MSDPLSVEPRNVVIVGAGPAGLFAAEIIAAGGHRVSVFERMPTPGRKFLFAGRGGLNLTHSEALEIFAQRYGVSAAAVREAVEEFPPSKLVAWANGLGIETFVGTSGRIFPRSMKASPLLRAWLNRLEKLGVTIQTRHRWLDFGDERQLLVENQHGQRLAVRSEATLMALGGASWPKLGSDGQWVDAFTSAGVPVTTMAPANCGVCISWSEIFRSRFAGAALKRITVTVSRTTVRGEMIVTDKGLEGGAIYALVPLIRRALDQDGRAQIAIDLKPDVSIVELTERLRRPPASATLTNFLRKAAHLDATAIGILREVSLPSDPATLAARIKSLPLDVTGLAPLDRAISTAGGVAWSGVDENFMLKARPGVFVAGEMLDWEAPTGGYLLQATFATASRAAKGLLRWLNGQHKHGHRA